MRKGFVLLAVLLSTSTIGEGVEARHPHHAIKTVSETSGISGRVTNASTGVGLSGVRILVYESGGSGLPVEDILTDADGYYATEDPLTPGDHWVRTKDTVGYVDEVHEDIPCPYVCNARDGTPIAIEIDTIATVDFALDPAASIGGEVTSSTEVPAAIAGADVKIYDSAGNYRASASSGIDGAWDTGAVLPAGTFFARVEKANAHFGELFDSIGCPFWPGCDETSGTPIVLAAGEARSDVDFELERGGTISGTVIETLDGLGVAGATVVVQDASGNVLSTASTSPGGGAYTSTDALSAGTYYVRVADSGYWLVIEELYQDIWCPSGCEVTTGTPVPVAAGEDVVGIDFSLERFGAASGRLIAEDTGQAIPQAYVHVFDVNGDFVEGAPDLLGTGHWVTDRTLIPGEYYARSFNSKGYVDQLYNGIECDECDVTTGTRFTVNPATTTSNIDFVLEVDTEIFANGFEAGDFTGWTVSD